MDLLAVATHRVQDTVLLLIVHFVLLVVFLRFLVVFILHVFYNVLINY